MKNIFFVDKAKQFNQCTNTITKTECLFQLDHFLKLRPSQRFFIIHLKVLFNFLEFFPLRAHKYTKKVSSQVIKPEANPIKEIEPYYYLVQLNDLTQECVNFFRQGADHFEDFLAFLTFLATFLFIVQIFHEIPIEILC